jgi:hypothetical protein
VGLIDLALGIGVTGNRACDQFSFGHPGSGLGTESGRLDRPSDTVSRETVACAVAAPGVGL